MCWGGCGPPRKPDISRNIAKLQLEKVGLEHLENLHSGNGKKNV